MISLQINNSTIEHDTTKLVTSFTQSQPYILMISVSCILKTIQNLWNPLIIDVMCKNSPFLQYTQNTKQLISLDSLFWAEHYGRNDSFVACTVFEIFDI